MLLQKQMWAVLCGFHLQNFLVRKKMFVIPCRILQKVTVWKLTGVLVLNTNKRNDSHSARKDRALDNIRIERLWRSLKYEDIYPKPYETMKDLNAGINACFNFYNTARFHQSLDYNVPDEMYKCFQYNEPERKRAA